LSALFLAIPVIGVTVRIRVRFKLVSDLDEHYTVSPLSRGTY